MGLDHRLEVAAMAIVLVTGGTGHLGRELVERLRPAYRVRVLARSPGSGGEVDWVRGDLATGAGVAQAVAGVSAVVHAATCSPAARRGYLRPADLWRSPLEVDVDGTRLLLEAAARSGVDHFAYISIVGVDRPRGPYLRLKLTAEELVRESGVPFSILRATQFHWLLDRMLGKAARLPVLPLPTRVPVQPVDPADFAGYVAECLADGPGGRREDFAGPEVLTLGTLVDQWQWARGRPRKVIGLYAPAPLMRAAYTMTAPYGRRGTTTWADWLGRRGGR
ncbi:NAD(P)H-binding protein [Kitasatospora sp. NPDC048540]|uniref:SDR family oxidoreductase n=1 Tax=unclassified Kitasatospora TaxID=2633591 RepID=UPI000B229059|nr:NAD(P)H-binding protein [Kitasatospora sp. MBT63]